MSVLPFLLTAWGGAKRGASWVISRPWVGYLLAVIGIGVAYKAWKAEVARQARERERLRIEMEQITAKAETIVKIRKLEQETRTDVRQAEKAADDLPDFDSVEQLRNENPSTYNLLFGARHGGGSDSGAKED